MRPVILLVVIQKIISEMLETLWPNAVLVITLHVCFAATTAAEMYQNLHVAFKVDGQQGAIRNVADGNICTVQLGEPASSHFSVSLARE